MIVPIACMMGVIIVAGVFVFVPALMPMLGFMFMPMLGFMVVFVI